LDRSQPRFLSLPFYQICAFIFVRTVHPSTLMMQFVGFSEMSICIYASTHHNIPGKQQPPLDTCPCSHYYFYCYKATHCSNYCQIARCTSMILSNTELTRMTGCINFKTDISYVVTKWSNTQLKIHKGLHGSEHS